MNGALRPCAFLCARHELCQNSQNSDGTVNMLKTILLCLMLVGCTASVGNNFDDSKLAQIKTDQTTRQQLIALFGQPSTETPFPEGQSILMWTYSQAKAMSTTEGRTLTIRLMNGKVKSYTVSKT